MSPRAGAALGGIVGALIGAVGAAAAGERFDTKPGMSPQRRDELAASWGLFGLIAGGFVGAVIGAGPAPSAAIATTTTTP